MEYYILAAYNLLVFAIYGIDKWKAKHKKWRISEATLIGLAFLMGAFGAVAGMSVFRHKTKHIKFKLLVPLALVINVVAILYYMGVIG